MEINRDFEDRKVDDIPLVTLLSNGYDSLYKDRTLPLTYAFYDLGFIKTLFVFKL